MTLHHHIESNIFGELTDMTEFHKSDESVRMEKSRKKYVDCLTYKNIACPLSSYENQSNANRKKNISEEKYRVKKSR